MGIRAAALGLAIGACLGVWPPVLAADVRVVCPNALRAPVVESARAFARSGGHRIEFVFAAVAAVHKRVATGERADVVIGTAQGTDALIRLGRGVEGSFVPLARSALALALPSHAIAPEIRDAASLVEALRRARTLVAPDANLGVPGGAQTADLLERLGLTEELRARTRYVADARDIAKRVAGGTADIGIGAMSHLTSSSGIALLGPLTDPTTEGIVYAAIIARTAANVDLARDFIGHLRSPQSQALLRKAGYLPVD
jgi:molybdate transport system substrate-binding protein